MKTTGCLGNNYFYSDKAWDIANFLIQQNDTSKEKILQELMGAKEDMQATIDELYSKLEEKERQSREMLSVVKDIESRFAHFYMSNGEASVINENGEIQYR